MKVRYYFQSSLHHKSVQLLPKRKQITNKLSTIVSIHFPFISHHKLLQCKA